MSELPSGWVAIRLGEIANFEMGQAPPGAASNFEGRGKVFVKADEFGPRRPVVREWTTDPKKFATADDVLICVVGATAGKLNLGIDCAIGRSVAAIRPTPAIQQLLLYFQLLTRVDELRAGSTGSAQGVISRDMLANLNVVLPPLPEQKRIADKLDAVLARVDACRERLARVPAIVKRFRQAVLAAATTGKLTEEWRNSEEAPETSWLATISDKGVPLPTRYQRLFKQEFKSVRIEHSAYELPATWNVMTIGELYKLNVLIDFADGNHGSLYPRKEDFSDSGALFLTATQIGEKWELDLQGCPRLRDEKAKQLTKGWARTNDVLLTHNATVGRVALIEETAEDVLLGTSVTFYRFNSQFILPRFARVLFSSTFFQEQLQSVMEQTTRNQVPITKQVSLNFICPPIIEQHEIVRRVEYLFASADRLEARYAAAYAQVEHLTPALLSKAFRGELVPQDPHDEPAFVLLERIRAVPAAAPDKPKRSKGRSHSKKLQTAEVLMLNRKDIEDGHLTTILKERGPLTAEALWSASQLDIDDFYEQLKDEETRGLLKEQRGDSATAPRTLLAAA